MAYATVNPYTGEKLKSFPDATEEQVKQAIDDADKAFAAWRTTPFATRAAVLSKAAALLRQNKTQFASLLTLEMGKLIGEAEAEVELSAAILTYFAEQGEALLQPDQLPVPAADGKAYIVHEPLGVLLAVEPWNFPY